MASVMLAMSNSVIIGALHPSQYKGVEHSWPHGWKDLGRTDFDVVDLDCVNQQMANAMVQHYNPKHFKNEENSEKHIATCPFCGVAEKAITMHQAEWIAHPLPTFKLPRISIKIPPRTLNEHHCNHCDGTFWT